MKTAIENLDRQSALENPSPQDFCIEGPISAENLQALVSTFPFEVGITEQDGRLILSAGVPGFAHHPDDSESYERHVRSKVSFHTHPVFDGTVYDSPSFGDLVISQRRARYGVSGPELIAHPRGLTVFRAPDENGLIGEDIDDFCEKEGVERFTFADDKPSRDRIAAASRKFAEVSGSIVAEARWDEPDKIEQILGLFRHAQKQEQ